VGVVFVGAGFGSADARQGGAERSAQDGLTAAERADAW